MEITDKAGVEQLFFVRGTCIYVSVNIKEDYSMSKSKGVTMQSIYYNVMINEWQCACVVYASDYSKDC
jgi:hypothetical protein